MKVLLYLSKRNRGDVIEGLAVNQYSGGVTMDKLNVCVMGVGVSEAISEGN